MLEFQNQRLKPLHFEDEVVGSLSGRPRMREVFHRLNMSIMTAEQWDWDSLASASTAITFI